MTETTQDERDEVRRFCTVPVAFINDADRLAAIERQVRELEQLDTPADPLVRAFVDRLRALIDAPDGEGT